MINAVSNVNFGAVGAAYPIHKKDNVTFKGEPMPPQSSIEKGMEWLIGSMFGYANKATNPNRVYHTLLQRIWWGASRIVGGGAAIFGAGFAAKQALNAMPNADGNYITTGLEALAGLFTVAVFASCIGFVRSGINAIIHGKQSE